MGPGSYSPGPYGGSPPHHVYPGGGPYGVSPPQSAVYDGQVETVFTYRGQGAAMGDGGQGGGVDGNVYALYGVPQHARHSPGAYGSAQFPNRGTQVYEFEYEEPRFT